MYRIKLTENIAVGDGLPPFIVAEIGINHNGRLELALEMIKKAKEIGVNAVKFQVKDVEEAHPKEMLDMPYEGPNSFGKTYREHKLALEFSQEQLKQIYEYARKLNIPCFSTPCNVNAVKRLEKLDNPFYKIASFHLTWHELVEEVCKTGKPIILSTGASTVEEIDKTVELIRKYGNPFALLHCVSSYPTEDKDINFSVIPSLRERYECPVGYSGHERGVGLTIAAVALGACIIERHFTLDRTMKGPDHASSIEPAGMQLLVSRAKRLFEAMGSPEITVYDCELANRKKFRGY
jgi:sialic acid synthase SpsE